MQVTLIAKSYDNAYLHEHPCTSPLFSNRVSADFPSPAQDYIEQALDLNALCIKHPAATFLFGWKVIGHPHERVRRIKSTS